MLIEMPFFTTNENHCCAKSGVSFSTEHITNVFLGTGLSISRSFLQGGGIPD